MNPCKYIQNNREKQIVFLIILEIKLNKSGRIKRRKKQNPDYMPGIFNYVRCNLNYVQGSLIYIRCNFNYFQCKSGKMEDLNE